MRFKVQVVENGIARDLFFDSARELICVRDIFPGELDALARCTMGGKPVIFCPDDMARKPENRPLFQKFAKEWPIQFFSGSHKAPTGLLLAPDGSKLIERKS